MGSPEAPEGTPQASPPTAVENTALTKVMVYAIIGIAAGVIGAVVFVAMLFPAFSSATTISYGPIVTPNQVTSTVTPLYQAFQLLSPAASFIGILGYAFLLLGFRDFARVDAPSFRTPWRFMFLAIVGGIVGTLLSTYSALVTAGLISNPCLGTSSPVLGGACGFPADFPAYTIFVFFADALALVGAVGGTILGLWRVGARYKLSIIQVGGVLTIFPVIGAIAPFLVVAGAYQAKGRVGKPA
jgi:hypothetical protein